MTKDPSIKIHISSNGICRFKKYGYSITEQCCAERLDIKEINIPIKIKAIGRKAFEKCSKLQRIIFEKGNNLNRIGEKAFSETAIKILDLSNCSNISILSNQLCMNCKDLEVVFLPDGVSIIGMECFSGCISLKNVYYLGKTEPRLESGVFDNCESFNGLKPIERKKISSIIAQINDQEVKKKKHISASDIWNIASSPDSGNIIVKASTVTNIAVSDMENRNLGDEKATK